MAIGVTCEPNSAVAWSARLCQTPSPPSPRRSLEMMREFNERVPCSPDNRADEPCVRKGREGNISLACVSLIELMKTSGRPCRVHRSLAR